MADLTIYIGQTRSHELIARLRDLGWGEMTSRGEVPPRRTPWALDNGAFVDWRRGRPFDAGAFERDCELVAANRLTPDFLVVPDLVAEGLRSLEFSLAWVPRLEGLAPLYLAVQDGMTPEDLAGVLDPFAGLLVGGSLPWKLRTGEMWVEVAKRAQRRIHIGRAGTYNRVRWAQRIGADSIDSCLPLWSEANLTRFMDALIESSQGELAL